MLPLISRRPRQWCSLLQCCNAAMLQWSDAEVQGMGHAKQHKKEKATVRHLTPTALKVSNSNALEATTRNGECKGL